MFRITEHLASDELKSLIEPSDFRGFLSIATSWGMIAANLFMVALYPAWWTILIALVLVGGRHLALAILMHEGAHRSLFKTPWLHVAAVQWLCAYPTWNDMIRYREHHLRHHANTRTDKDPDQCLSEPFPVTRASLMRKLLRDFFGITGIKRIIGLLTIDFGYYTYTISSGAKKIDQTGRTLIDVLRTGINNLRGAVIANAIFFAILWLSGHHPALYLIWIFSYLTTFSVFIRVRSLAEHAATPDAADPLNNTRTTLANPLARHGRPESRLLSS
jgi:fatty acid desaturase